MANNLYYFDGTGWQPISSGGGGTPGPQGPPGKSINVFVQPTTPTNPSVGDHWINETVARKTYKTLDDLKTYKTLDDI